MRSGLSISVAVPCHNNAQSLELLVRTASSQLRAGDELIFVDDQSTEAEREKITYVAGRSAARLLSLPPAAAPRELLGRRSHARNLATSAAKGDIILYLDGDMLLAPSYLDEIRRHHGADATTMVRGERIAIDLLEQCRGPDHCVGLALAGASSRTEDPVSYAVSNPSSHLLEMLLAFLTGAVAKLPLSRRDFSALVATSLGSVPAVRFPPTSHLAQFYSARWDNCASNNLSLLRAYVVAEGGWDERFVGWGEEDMDFAYRMFRRGLRPVLPRGPSVRAFHLDHPVDRAGNRATLLANARYLLSKHPELRWVRQPAYTAWDIRPEELT